MLEEENYGVERLVLRGRRNLPLDGQVGQKLFNLMSAHPAWDDVVA